MSRFSRLFLVLPLFLSCCSEPKPDPKASKTPGQEWFQSILSNGGADRPPAESGAPRTAIQLEELKAILAQADLPNAQVSFQARIHAGGEIIATPTIVTRPGKQATIEVVRELHYPTDYEAPKLAEEGPGLSPATPTAFETENVGLKMTITPEIRENLLVIRGLLQFVEFFGFIDAPGNVLQPIEQDGVILTENKALQPIFRRYETPIFFMGSPADKYRMAIDYPGDPDAYAEIAIGLVNQAGTKPIMPIIPEVKPVAE